MTHTRKPKPVTWKMGMIVALAGLSAGYGFMHATPLMAQYLVMTAANTGVISPANGTGGPYGVFVVIDRRRLSPAGHATMLNGDLELLIDTVTIGLQMGAAMALLGWLICERRGSAHVPRASRSQGFAIIDAVVAVSLLGIFVPTGISTTVQLHGTSVAAALHHAAGVAAQRQLEIARAYGVEELLTRHADGPITCNLARQVEGVLEVSAIGYSADHTVCTELEASTYIVVHVAVSYPSPFTDESAVRSIATVIALDQEGAHP